MARNWMRGRFAAHDHGPGAAAGQRGKASKLRGLRGLRLQGYALDVFFLAGPYGAGVMGLPARSPGPAQSRRPS